MPILPDMYPCKPDIFEATYSPAALAAGQATAAQAVVPAEWPTNEMIDAGRKAAASQGRLLGSGQSLWHVFRAMLAAAPAQQAAQPGAAYAALPDEVVRLAQVAIRECQYKGNDMPQDWMESAMRACRLIAASQGQAPAQPSDPHAELRKAWTPGHKWQWTSAAEEGRWWSHNGEPEWNPEWRYRLAPARPVAEPSQFGSPELQAMILARCIEKDRASHGQAPAQPDPAYSAACNLATALFKKYFAHLPDFASGQAVWGLCGSTAGVISQIDNMVSGLLQPPTTAPHADSVLEDAARWQMVVLVGNEVMLHPEKRSYAAAVAAYMDAVHRGLDLTGAIDSARKQGGA